jgi:hypothetical protein
MCDEPDSRRAFFVAGWGVLYRRWGSFRRVNIGRCHTVGWTFAWGATARQNGDSHA